MRTDVHAHYFPAKYVECLARLGKDVSGASAGPGAGLSLAERLELMDTVGVDMQVLSVAQEMPYFTESPTNGVEAARLGNDLYADVCQQYRDRFAAFGAVPLPHVDETLAEVERCLDRLGMVGITVGCTVAGRPLDDPAFEPFFAELDRRRAVLFLHPMGTGAGPQTSEYGLTWMIGAPVEDAMAALRLVLSGLTSRYPNVRIIVPHLGGFLPFLLQRLDDQAHRLRATGEPLPIEGNPSTYLKRLWYDTVGSHPPALRCACESFGADRLLLGTDFPYLAGPRFQRAVTYMEEAELPEDDTAAIRGGNAQALLNLGGR